MAGNWNCHLVDHRVFAISVHCNQVVAITDLKQVGRDIYCHGLAGRLCGKSGSCLFPSCLSWQLSHDLQVLSISLLIFNQYTLLRASRRVFSTPMATWRPLKMTLASTASSSRKDQYTLRSVGSSLTSRNVSSFNNCCLDVGKLMSAIVKCLRSSASNAKPSTLKSRSTSSLLIGLGKRLHVCQDHLLTWPIFNGEVVALNLQ